MYKKILVIRLSSLGDVILTTALLKEIRKLYPVSQIDFCTKTEYAEPLRFNPNINNIIEADNDSNFSRLRILKKKLRNEKYDIIIDAHNKINTFYLRSFLSGKKLKLKKYSFRKFLLVNFKINLMKNLDPIIVRYMKLISDTEYSGQYVPEIYANSIASKEVDSIISNINPEGKDMFCIVPSSKHFTKTYPSELYAKLIKSIQMDKYCIILTGKGIDRKNIEEIMSGVDGGVNNLCDKLSILHLYELMKKCRLVICGDTGPMHAAEATGVPIILLAGSSVKEFGFYPQSKNAIVLENNHLHCRPCSHIGRDSCPKKHFKCMREIYPAEIKNAIESFLLVN